VPFVANGKAGSGTAATTGAGAAWAGGRPACCIARTAERMERAATAAAVGRARSSSAAGGAAVVRMVGGAPGGATTSTGGWMRARMPEDSGACTGAVAARWGGVGADRRRQLLQPRLRLHRSSGRRRIALRIAGRRIRSDRTPARNVSAPVGVLPFACGELPLRAVVRSGRLSRLLAVVGTVITAVACGNANA